MTKVEFYKYSGSSLILASPLEKQKFSAGETLFEPYKKYKMKLNMYNSCEELDSQITAVELRNLYIIFGKYYTDKYRAVQVGTNTESSFLRRIEKVKSVKFKEIDKRTPDGKGVLYGIRSAIVTYNDYIKNKQITAPFSMETYGYNWYLFLKDDGITF